MKVWKLDRVTGQIVGSDNFTNEQMDRRALNKTVVALPVEDVRLPFNPDVEEQREVLSIPDLSDLTVDVPADAKITVTYENVPLPQARIDEIAAQKKAAELAATDNGYIRVLEDLIDALILAGTVTIDQLPQSAQDKHNVRRVLRGKAPHVVPLP